MKSMWNPNRFLRSISPTHHGNPQPLRSTKRRIIAMLFNSKNFARRKIRKRTIFLPLSSPLLRGPSA